MYKKAMIYFGHGCNCSPLTLSNIKIPLEVLMPLLNDTKSKVFQAQDS